MLSFKVLSPAHSQKRQRRRGSTPNIESTNHAMHATALRSSYESHNRELWVTHDSKTPTLRINDLQYTALKSRCVLRGTWAKMRSELDRSGTGCSKTCCTRVRGASWEIGTWARLRRQHTSVYAVPASSSSDPSRAPDAQHHRHVWYSSPAY